MSVPANPFFIRFDSVAAVALYVQQLLKYVWSLTGGISSRRS